jgi:hypothetical protein
VLNFWTHAMVGLELLFGLLIFHRLARPLLLAASLVHWTLIGLVTGLLSYAAAMLVANVVFISPAILRHVCRGTPAPAGSAARSGA